MISRSWAWIWTVSYTHLGVPTINQLYPQGFQLPRFGIYITRTKIGDTWYPSATGLGTRPLSLIHILVRAPSGEISIDPVGKKPGRGAYLCPDAACLAKAKKKKALERCLEQPVPAEVYDALARQLAAVEQEAAQDGKE